MTDTSLDLSSELVVQAARLVRAVRRATGDDAAPVRILSLLDEIGPTTVGGLARADRSSQPTMSGAVAALVDRGWVEKQPHPTDARAALVVMTAAGRAALADVRHRNAALVAERLAGTAHTDADLARAVAVLRDLLSQPHEGRPEEGTA